MTLDMNASTLVGLVDEISKAGESSGKAVQHVATVLRTDSTGTTWVSIAGGTDETPVHTRLVEADPGDVVSVTIAGGRVTMSGNVSSPTASGRTTEVTQQTAISAHAAASDALNAASVANEAALSAIDSASLANSAAAEAQESAEQAVQDAATASEQALSAQSSATQANTYAIGALSSLSDVEKVVGTLNWIAEHGTYSQTTDNVVQQGKSYYTYDGTDYAQVQNPTQDGLYSYALTDDEALEEDKTYYERVVEYTYFPTEDTEIDVSKTYYEFDEDEAEYVEVSEPDAEDIIGYFERTETIHYDAVEEPDIDDIATYYERFVAYYELNIDVSVQNYIASHLSLTDDGLNLTADSSKYRAVLAVDGLQIIDPQGNLVGLHGQTIQLGKASEVHFEATASKLAFKAADQDIAWFGQNSDGIWEMHISTTYAEDMIRFGDYAWIKRQNGNMTIKWLGAVS